MRFSEQAKEIAKSVSKPLKALLSMGRPYMFCLSLAILLPAPAYAQASTISGQVELLYHFHSHSGILVRIAGMMTDPDSCGRTDWYIFPDSASRVAFVQSMLLTARSTGATVSVTIEGCHQGLPRILNVAM